MRAARRAAPFRYTLRNCVVRLLAHAAALHAGRSASCINQSLCKPGHGAPRHDARLHFKCLCADYEIGQASSRVKQARKQSGRLCGRAERLSEQSCQIARGGHCPLQAARYERCLSQVPRGKHGHEKYRVANLELARPHIRRAKFSLQGWERLRIRPEQGHRTSTWHAPFSILEPLGQPNGSRRPMRACCQATLPPPPTSASRCAPHSSSRPSIRRPPKNSSRCAAV